MPFTFKKSQKAVAAFIIISIFLFGIFVFLIIRGSNLFELKDTYVTVLDSGYGIKKGSSLVEYKDMEIGQVTAMDLTEGNKIRLEVAILKKYSQRLINQESVLKVVGGLGGILGAKLVLVTTPSQDIPRLEPGQVIFSSDTREGKALLEQMGESNPQDELMLKVKQILDGVIELEPLLIGTMRNVKDSTGSLTAILQGLQGTGQSAVSDKLLATLDDVKGILASLKELSDEINSPKNTIGALVRDKKALMAKLEATLASVESITKNVDKLSAGLPSQLNTTVASLQLVLRDVGTITRELSAKMGTTMSSVDGILKDAKTLTGGLANNWDAIMFSLKGVLANVDKITAKLAGGELDSILKSADKTMKDVNKLSAKLVVDSVGILASVNGIMKDVKTMSEQLSTAPEDIQKTIRLLNANLLELKQVLQNLPLGIGSGSGKKDTGVIKEGDR